MHTASTSFNKGNSMALNTRSMASDKASNKTYHDELGQVLSGGVHYNFRTMGAEQPLFFNRAAKSRLFDIENTEYLDFYCKFGAMILGHGNRDHANTLKEQIDKVLCANHSDLDCEVASKIRAAYPSMERMRFGLSGSELVQNAIRLARAYTGRQRFVRFEGHYHGNVDNIMGGKIRSYPDAPEPVEFTGDPRGTMGRAQGVMQAQSFMARWNDLPGTTQLIETHHAEIACLILEPICVNGGGIAPSAGFLEGLRQLCDRHGILLVFDEVITGCRVALGGAQQLLGVKPDITILGKAIGGGLPVSVMGGRADVFEWIARRDVIHAGTFNGYPLGMAAVNSTLSILGADQGAYYQRAARYGAALTEVLQRHARKYEIPLSTSCFGGLVMYNCTDAAIDRPDQIDFETTLRNRCFLEAMAQHRILISPISRMFINVLFDDSDIAFFSHHADAAFQAAKDMMEKAGI